MRVLVADDDVISRRILGAALERNGHDVEVVDDGAQAWARLERRDGPQLAVLDWEMPGLDGLEICRRLSPRSGDRYVYVLLITSSDSHHDIAAALESGADDFIAKPFDPDELSARVRAGQRIIEFQASMAHSQAYLEAVLSHIDSGVLLMDGSGRVVYVNDALVRMLGMPHERALQLTRADFVRLHAERFGAANTLAGRLGVGEMLPLDAEIDLEVTRPERRVFRWIAKQVPLPEGLGQLDLLRDVTDEVERDRHQAELARIDHLTGLLNRHAADESFAREVARARRTKQPLSVVLSDIDLFKRVNDTFGHGTGDQVLREVSRALSACCRVTDVAIRWGGEELLALLPNTSLEGALSFAERLRAAVEALAHPDLPRVTISCGVAELQHEDSGLDSTMERADARLYEAKACGRNAVR